MTAFCGLVASQVAHLSANGHRRAAAVMTVGRAAATCVTFTLMQDTHLVFKRSVDTKKIDPL
jgi:hypothetical protein